MRWMATLLCSTCDKTRNVLPCRRRGSSHKSPVVLWLARRLQQPCLPRQGKLPQQTQSVGCTSHQASLEAQGRAPCHLFLRLMNWNVASTYNRSKCSHESLHGSLNTVCCARLADRQRCLCASAGRWQRPDDFGLQNWQPLRVWCLRPHLVGIKENGH